MTAVRNSLSPAIVSMSDGAQHAGPDKGSRENRLTKRAHVDKPGSGISVSDKGPGIPLDLIADIFKSLFGAK